MATNTAASQDPSGATTPLWQAPVFVLGVAALVAVWFCRPLWPDSAARRIEADLARAREMLLRPESDLDQALKLARTALDSSAIVPDRAGEAAFLVGSVCIRLAEKSDPVRAGEHWQAARDALELALREGVSNEDQGDLLYRLAKVSYFLSDQPANVIARLEEAVPNCSTRAEGYRLLTEVYLRLPKPDLEKALEANRKLRDVQEASELELTQAKLQAGEILLRMGKPEEAQRALEKISESVSPALLVRARVLRARAFQDEKRWGDATRLYNAVLADTRAPLADPAQIYYELGQCYRQLDQPQESTKALQECVRLSRGFEGAAAAIVLAEQRLAEQSLEPALELLTQAVARVKEPRDWKNPYVELKRAREAFESMLLAARRAGRYDLALKVLEPYGKIAIPRRVLVMRGEIASEWARMKLDTPASPDIDRQAEELFRLAGEAFATVAKTKDLPIADQGEYLWKAARCYLDGKDEAKATSLLEQVVTMNLEPLRLGEAWHRLFLVYRAAGKQEMAEKAGLKCMEYDTPFAYRVRHAMSMAKLESGDVDEAEKGLVLNIKLLRWESDPEAMAESLFALTNLLYQRKDYRRVVPYLENALHRFPDSPELTRARYLLADSYRQIASQENQSSLLKSGLSEEAKAHFLREHRRLMRRSAEEFAILVRILESPEGKNHLTPELREQIPFIAAKCLYHAGEYSEAVKLFEKLIDKYEGRVESLEALGGAVSCYSAMGQLEKVKQRLVQIKLLLPRMDEEVRQPWEAWVNEASRMLNETP